MRGAVRWSEDDTAIHPRLSKYFRSTYFLVLIQESSKENQAQMIPHPLWSKRSMAGRVSQIVGRGIYYGQCYAE